MANCRRCWRRGGCRSWGRRPRCAGEGEWGAVCMGEVSETSECTATVTHLSSPPPISLPHPHTLSSVPSPIPIPTPPMQCVVRQGPVHTHTSHSLIPLISHITPTLSLTNSLISPTHPVWRSTRPSAPPSSPPWASPPCPSSPSQTLQAHWQTPLNAMH